MDEILEYLDEGLYKKAKEATANSDMFADVAGWMFDNSVATPYEHREQVHVLEYYANDYVPFAERNVSAQKPDLAAA